MFNARQNGATFSEIARITGHPESEVRAAVSAHKAGTASATNGHDYMKATESPKPAPWKCPPVHPAADWLPMMSDAELDDLAADIDKNGLKDPIVIWIDNSEEPKGTKGPFAEFLLEGRNRIKALERIGIKNPYRAAPLGSFHLGVTKVAAFKRSGSLSLDDYTITGRWEAWVNPEVYVLSANVHRRHLTPAQKREAIKRFINADPRASNRKVARTLKIDDKTVADVRSESAQNAEIPQNAHLPLERAKATVRKNPALSNKALAKIAGVSDHTIAKARQELIAAGEITPPQKLTAHPPKRKPTVKPEKKSEQAALAAPKVKPLIVEMFIGTCTLKNPLPTWYVVDDANRDNAQVIVCDGCKSYTMGGQSLGSFDEWYYECRCKDSHRDAEFERKKRQ